MRADSLGPTGRTQPLLERGVEVDRLTSAIDAARSAAGRAVIVEGPSGIGKSRLLTEAADAAHRAGFCVLRASGGEFERDYPAGVVLDLFQAHMSTHDEVEQQHLLRGSAASAGAVLQSAGVGTEALPAPERFVLLNSLFWLVAHLAELRPVAVIVDDVHWADDFSLHFLAYLAARLPNAAVVLVVAVRTGDPVRDEEVIRHLYDAAAAQVLRPTSLSDVAVAALVAADASDDHLDADLVASIVSSTGGNPFLVRELTAAATNHPHGWRAAIDDPDGFAPSAVARNVMTRLRRFGGGALALARAASVLGDGVSLIAVADLAELTVEEAQATAERLRHVQVLRAVDPMTFGHKVLRAAVYSEIPTDLRPALHKGAAKTLRQGFGGPDAIAGHLILAPPSSEEWVRSALYDGGRLAMRRGSPDTAIRYFRRALETWPATQSSAQICVDLALCEAAVGEPRSIARFVDALTQIEDPVSRAEPLYALGHTLYRRGRHREAADTFREGADLLALADPERMLWFESAYAACAHYLPALRPDAFVRLEAVTTGIAESGPRTEAERAVLGVLSLYKAASAPANARLPQQILTPHDQPAHQIVGGIQRNLAMTSLIWGGAPGDVLDRLDTELRDARERGDTLALTEASFIRGLALYRLGRVRDAAEDAHVAVDGTTRGWGATVPGGHGVLVDCLLAQGKAAEAYRIVDEAAALVRGADFRPSSAWYYWSRGRLRAQGHDAEGALTDFLRVGQILQAVSIYSPGAFSWRSEAAAAAHATGDDAHARELLATQLELAEKFGLPDSQAETLRVRAAMEDHDQAVVTLKDAALRLAGRQSLVCLEVLVALGARRRRAGSVRAARDDLRRALELASRHGASALADQARLELLASGARPRRDHISGVDALTSSELRIAQLAADGLINRQVAGALYLTKNTVEWHLRNVYRKLDITSRDQLPAALVASRHQGSTSNAHARGPAADELSPT